MSEVKTDTQASRKYSLLSVVKIPPPAGMSGDNWYSYEIGQPENISGRSQSTITGNRSGTLKQVTSYANKFVDELNFRNSSSGYSIWSPRQKK